MRTSRWTHLLLTTTTCAVLAAAPTADAAAAQGDVRINADVRVNRTVVPSREVYELGYRDGLQRGEQDGRGGRDFNYDRDSAYRSGDRGYDRRYGSRDVFRVEFRRGYAAGYRVGYDRVRVIARDRRDNGRWDRRVPRGYQEPAAAQGYIDGYEQGLDDARDRDRYDPVRHSDYREGDEGYRREYGSKDAYRNNYRAGFRQGYEDGYRNVRR